MDKLLGYNTPYHSIAMNAIGLITIVLSLFLLNGTGWLIAGVMFILFQGVGISVTYHRYYAHNSFKFKHEWMRKLFTLFGLMAGQSNPVSWAAVHKAHHKSTDTHEDPHSPVHGLVRAFLWMLWYPHDIRTAARLARDPFNLFLYKYGAIVMVAYWVVLYLLGDWWLVISAGFLPTGLSLLCTNSANYFLHLYGYKSYDTVSQDKNWWVFAILFFGEGWHNNHHHKPNEYSFQHQWWEIDPGAWVIRRIKDAD